MIYVYIKDQIKIGDIVNNKDYALISSVNMSNDTKENNELRPIHRLIRAEEFKAFSNEIKEIHNKLDDLYIKYGGMCFLWGKWDNSQEDFKNLREEYYRMCKENLDFVLSKEYIVDPLKNNGLLDKCGKLATVDKMILDNIFKYKDSSLIYYRPKPQLINKEKEDIIKFFEEKTPRDLKDSNCFINMFEHL